LKAAIQINDGAFLYIQNIVLHRKIPRSILRKNEAAGSISSYVLLPEEYVQKLNLLVDV
jgi:hypothetical protein